MTFNIWMDIIVFVVFICAVVFVGLYKSRGEDEHGRLGGALGKRETCRLGAYVHGMAGDIAARRKGETSMTASDIIECLPEAWNTLQS